FRAVIPPARRPGEEGRGSEQHRPESEGESRRRGIASLAEETTPQQREKIQTGDPGNEVSGGDVSTRINHLGRQPSDREEGDLPRPQRLRLEKAGPRGPEETEDKGGSEAENEDAGMLQGR